MEVRTQRSSIHWRRLFIASATLAVAVTLLAPLMQRRPRSRGNLPSINNLKNLALAVHNYATSNKGSMPYHGVKAIPLSWRVDVLQYLDRAQLARQYDRSRHWNDPINAAIGREWQEIFDTPEIDSKNTNAAGCFRSDYGLISGPGTVNPGDRAVTLDEISDGDGLGPTLLIGECAGLHLGWTEPRDPRVDREEMGIEILTKPGQSSNRLLSGYMTGTIGVVFADGAARGLSHKIDLKVLAALCTISGGEPITQADYLR